MNTQLIVHTKKFKDHYKRIGNQFVRMSIYCKDKANYKIKFNLRRHL